MSVGVWQAKRALRDIARVSFCGDVDLLLRAVFAVMLAEEGNEEGSPPGRGFAESGIDGNLVEECGAISLSEVGMSPSMLDVRENWGRT